MPFLIRLFGVAALLCLQLGVVVRELVEEDGDGHAVQNDSKGNADEGEEPAQVSLGVHVAVAHGRDACLKGKTCSLYKMLEACHYYYFVTIDVNDFIHQLLLFCLFDTFFCS